MRTQVRASAGVEHEVPESGGDLRRLMIAAVTGVLAAAGCAPEDPQPPAGEAEGSGVTDEAASSRLASSLNVRVEGDTVRFALLVTNATGEARVLEFPTAQRMDFTVATPSGEVVWQWSAGMGFAQMLGADTLAAGASREYEATWAPGGRTGQYVATGRVTSTNTPIELRTEFEIPER